MTELEYLAIGYVFFILLIGLEACASIIRGDGRYRLHETIGNIGHGVVYQTFDYYTKAFVSIPFVWIAAHFADVQVPMDTLWAWILAIVLYDLTSYWAHRHSHEINAMWSVHAVHHAAEDFNLAAALRQPLFSHLFTWIYRLPLAFIMTGKMFVLIVVIDYIYQFILHTQYVQKLGPIGWVLNTPSHHRVHHGRDPKYLDRNYGGMLIVWDRIFGTFQAEEEDPDYGITVPIGTLDPIWGNLVFWFRMVEDTRRAPNFRTRLAVWFRGPGEQGNHSNSPVDSSTKPAPITRSASMRTCIYILTHAMLALPVLPALIYFGQQWGPIVQFCLAAFILLSTTSLVALVENRDWARGLEKARVLVFALGLIWLIPASIQALGELWPDDASPPQDPMAHDHSS